MHYKKYISLLIVLASIVTIVAEHCIAETSSVETAGGWEKYKKNPVLGGSLGTCFDVSVLKVEDEFWMYFSWRPKKAVALVKSQDGIHWGQPRVVLEPNPHTEWETRINRPVVMRHNNKFHMWYTGQTKTNSFIGYAVSDDGVTFSRSTKEPVLVAEEPWEGVAVMCPHVIWDNGKKLFRMWYSAGEQYEPDAIGYATSGDGVHWTKHNQNPVFESDGELTWEQDKVTACQVIPDGDWYLMFFIGFEHEHLARIGVARSRDGINNWERLPANPIISPGGDDSWDGASCYKPYAIFEPRKNRWMLWYNGRRDGEHIGLATHEGEDLGFDPPKREQQLSPAEIPENGQSDANTSKSHDTSSQILSPDLLVRYVSHFNESDEELYTQYIPNSEALEFLKANIPLLECPDKDLEEIYYFRWWTYRKHIKKTPDGFVVTEFLPSVRWAGKHNTISCAAGHHFYEGRWLHDQEFLDDYARFWFRGGGEPRRYSFWAADAMLARHLVHPNRALLEELLDDLVDNYQAWEESRRDENELFWQSDNRDGMEYSIGGSGYRATINSYMYGDAIAIARIANFCERTDLADHYWEQAAGIKSLVQQRLWDDSAQFFKVLPRNADSQLVEVRELHGYTPWYFHLPDSGFEQAWDQLTTSKGFFAPYGPTTAEQRHSRFGISYEGHECQWNGPSWPYSTAVTLTALANVLNDYSTNCITKEDYFRLLKIYANSHRLQRPNGTLVPWIDENIDPETGEWIARSRLMAWEHGTWSDKKGGKERGKDYNHSTFCDLIITGLIGLRPRLENVVEVRPLLPEDTWDYFCLERLPYHGRSLSVVWDKTGERYHRGKGLSIFADGKKIASRPLLGELLVELPRFD